MFPTVAAVDAEVPYEKEEHQIATTTDPMLCNCVAYSKSKDPRLPFIDASMFEPNATPAVGNFALFFYPHSGLYHIGYIANISETALVVDESNYHSCTASVRAVAFNDPTLRGFYNPSGP